MEFVKASSPLYNPLDIGSCTCTICTASQSICWDQGFRGSIWLWASFSWASFSFPSTHQDGEMFSLYSRYTLIFLVYRLAQSELAVFFATTKSEIQTICTCINDGVQENLRIECGHQTIPSVTRSLLVYAKCLSLVPLPAACRCFISASSEKRKSANSVSLKRLIAGWIFHRKWCIRPQEMWFRVSGINPDSSFCATPEWSW